MRLLATFLVIAFVACGDSAMPPFRHTKELVVITRSGATTYAVDETQGAHGFDYDLLTQLAESLGLKLRIVLAANDADVLKKLERGEGHLAAAWLTPSDNPEIRSSRPYFSGQDVLVTHEGTLPVSRIDQLEEKIIHVVAGSRQADTLRKLREEIPRLNVIESKRRSELDLLERVAEQRYEATVVDEAVFDLASNHYPELEGAFPIGPALPIVFLFPRNSDPALIEKTDAFLEQLEKNGTLAQLRDRYFGHVDRLTMQDRLRFIERVQTVLPRYQNLFQSAQISTGIDWRIIAALSYQESHWDPLATSPTGVRGMMMLTEDTADRMRVTNRLDPEQSIRAGAFYLADLRDALPDSVPEQDRLWMAIAAYNLGMGHFNGARDIGRSLKVDTNSWYGMKKVLPLIARPEYYERLKSGRGRGGEAVITAENVRVYADILSRRLPAYRPPEVEAPPPSRALKNKTHRRDAKAQR